MPVGSFPAGVSMLLHLAGALLLGWVVGYERHFSARAAGTQVYCLVSTTSCAVTLLAGYPSLWYWNTVVGAAADPTHVIGAILTGIGFLGAGIIVKGDTSVRGLTTAASIWGSAAIGILVGVGFYTAAIGLTASFLVSIALVPALENRLPAHGAIVATLRFTEGYRPEPENVRSFLERLGLSMLTDSLSVSYDDHRFQIRCVVIANSRRVGNTLTRLSYELPQIPHVDSFTVAQYSRG
jgi:putative Mg2+ transporter-C (MgtC) family protein